MASNELQIRITAQLTELQNALNRANAQLDQFGQRARNAGGTASQGLGRASGAMATLIGLATRLTAAFAAIQAARALIGLADQAALLDARLKLATRSTEEFVRANAQLFDIAQRTGTSLQSTISIYTRLAPAIKVLGVAQDDFLQVTEAIAGAVQLSGTSAESAAAALEQFAQGLGEGALRGDELTSVLSQAPRLAQAIADGLQVPVTELRALGQAGELTAEKILGALRGQLPVIKAELDQLPVTFSRALTQLGNSSLKAVGQIDKAVGATSSLAEGLQAVSEYLDTGELQASFSQVVVTWTEGLSTIIDDIKRTANTIAENLPQAARDVGGALDILLPEIDTVTRAFRELPVNVRSFLQILVVEFASTFDKILIRARTFAESAKAVFTDDTVSEVARREQRDLDAVEQARQDSIQAIFDERQAQIDKGDAAAEAIRKEVAERERQRRQAGPAAPAATRRVQAPAGAADQLELIKDAVQRELAEIERAYDASEISARAYYARRRELQAQALDAELAQQNEALAKAKTDDEAGRSRILTQIAILNRQKADLARQGAIEEAEASRELEDRLVDVRARILTAEGRTVEARKLQLVAEFSDLIKKLEIEGDKAGANAIRKLIDVEVAKEQFAQIERQFSLVQDRLQAEQESIANQVTIGAISSASGNQQASAARKQALAELTELRNKAQALADTIKDPTISASADALTAALQRIGQEGAVGVELATQNLRAELAELDRTFATTAASAGVDAFAGLFTDLAEGAKSVGDAFKDFARSFAQSMFQVAARALATIAVLQILEALGGPGTAKLVGVTAGVGHTGGIAGNLATKRRVPALLFASAPRFHEGGMAGLKQGEVPAILKRGEEVLTQDDPRHVANGGGKQSGGGTRIINVIDPNLVQDYMTSSSGEKVLVNMIQRNAGAIRQVLA